MGKLEVREPTNTFHISSSAISGANRRVAYGRLGNGSSFSFSTLLPVDSLLEWLQQLGDQASCCVVTDSNEIEAQTGGRRWTAPPPIDGHELTMTGFTDSSILMVAQRRVVVGDPGPAQLRFFDAEEGKLLATVTHQINWMLGHSHRDAGSPIAVGPRHIALATAGPTGEGQQRELDDYMQCFVYSSTGERCASYNIPELQSAQYIQLRIDQSPNPRLVIAVGFMHLQPRVLDLLSGQELLRLAQCNSPTALWVGRRYIALGSTWFRHIGDKTLSLCCADTGEQLGLEVSGGSTTGLAMNASETVLISCIESNPCITVWSTEGRTLRKMCVLDGEAWQQTVTASAGVVERWSRASHHLFSNDFCRKLVALLVAVEAMPLVSDFVRQALCTFAEALARDSGRFVCLGLQDRQLADAIDTWDLPIAQQGDASLEPGGCRAEEQEAAPKAKPKATRKRKKRY